MSGATRKFEEFCYEMAKELGISSESFAYMIEFNVDYDNDGQLIIYTDIFRKSMAQPENLKDNKEIDYID